jgi:prolyl-tRNA synthetase
MRYSKILLRTNKEARKFDSINATLLQKAGFIDQTMAGVYTFLPLGWRVLNKIENIIREEMNTVGTEMLMPSLAPKALWETTGRDDINILFKATGANEASTRRNDASYIINPSHEEIITPIALKMKPSYKDLPFAVYQIQTKFRNEERPKSGLMRGREFRMKDLYSFHTTKEDMLAYYEKVKELYTKIFARLGIGDDTYITKASGGVFTKSFTHEFQTTCDSGEDTIYIDRDKKEAWNEEVIKEEDKEKLETKQASEVGNIFPLGTKYSEAFGYTYTDESGNKKPVVMASYGIGSSRVMGVLVEKFHDDRGIIWPDNIAPFQAHLVVINAQQEETVSKKSEDIYKDLEAQGIEVLFDDRESASGGEKLADADLIGIPWRIVVSSKTGDKVELKKRDKEETQLVETEEMINIITKNENSR